MVDVVLLDFYGTVVHEDDVVVSAICAAISESSARRASPKEVGRYWWDCFSSVFEQSHGSSFRLQREIEVESLASTIHHFGADGDAEAMVLPMFDHWQHPPMFADARDFLGALEIPVVIVSNIDRRDIEAAIGHHGLRFDGVFTSEDVRSYKPRSELFEAALASVGVGPERALHVGDSLTSDVAGAQNVGLPVAWVNRRAKPLPAGAEPTHVVPDLNAVRLLL